jgi:DNA-binding NarL/FixJ family response regulator
MKMKTAKKRVFIVDDHPMIREGTANVINMEPDMVLCGAVASAAEALTDIPKAKPDVVIVDLSLEGRSGLELIKCLRQHFPKVPVVVYTMHEQGLYAQRAIADGACGYVTKREPSSKLITTLRSAAGGATVRPALAKHSATAALPLGQLSDRELEVFELRGQGLTGDHIAARLHLSRKTVDSHLEHIKHKLGLADAREVLQRAVAWMQSKQTL